MTDAEKLVIRIMVKRGQLPDGALVTLEAGRAPAATAATPRPLSRAPAVARLQALLAASRLIDCRAANIVALAGHSAALFEWALAGGPRPAEPDYAVDEGAAALLAAARGDAADVVQQALERHWREGHAAWRFSARLRTLTGDDELASDLYHEYASCMSLEDVLGTA